MPESERRQIRMFPRPYRRSAHGIQQRARAIASLTLVAAAAGLMPLTATERSERAQSASPQTQPQWEFAGWYGGGCFPAARFDPFVPGRAYLVSDVAGVWRSENRGDSWQFKTRGLGSLMVAGLEVSLARKDLVFAATQGGLFVSMDAGETWRGADSLDGRISFIRPENHRSILPDPRDPDKVCVGTAGGEVFCSQDLGRSWRDMEMPRSVEAGESDPVVALVAAPDGSAMLGARASGIWRLEAGRSDWKRVSPKLTGVTDLIATPGGLVAAAGERVWRSGTDGRTFRAAAGRGVGNVFRLAYDDSSGRLFGAFNKDWEGAVFVSLNGGDVWRPLGSTMTADRAANPTRAWAHANSKITSLAVDPHRPGGLLRTDWWGVWRSDDGGRSFIERISGAPNTVGTDLAVSADGALWATTMDNGLLVSRDGGRSYAAVLPEKGYSAELNGHFWRVAVTPAGHVIATSSPWNADINQVFVSSDNGGSFKASTSGLPGARPRLGTLWEAGYPRGLAVDPFDPQTLYLAIDGEDGGGLYVSRDGGRSWKAAAAKPPPGKIYSALAADPGKRGMLYWGSVGEDGGIYRSADGGRAWQEVFTGSRAIFDMHVAADGAILATGDAEGAAVFISRDRGESWRTHRLAGAGSGKGIASHPGDPRIIAAGTAGWSYEAPQSVHLSTDGGETWDDITGSLPPGAGFVAIAFSADGRSLFASRYAGGIYRLDLKQLALPF